MKKRRLLQISENMTIISNLNQYLFEEKGSHENIFPLFCLEKKALKPRGFFHLFLEQYFKNKTTFETSAFSFIYSQKFNKKL